MVAGQKMMFDDPIAFENRERETWKPILIWIPLGARPVAALTEWFYAN